MTRRGVRYHVRDADGRELIVPTLSDLHALYTHGFLSDEDQVRAEGSQNWIRAGKLRALQGVREQRAESPRKVALLVWGLIVLATAIGILLSR
jgi:hypothetical protein